jgi:hypothetical protein
MACGEVTARSCARSSGQPWSGATAPPRREWAPRRHSRFPRSRAIFGHGAAKESNLPSVGLPRPAGFEDQMGEGHGGYQRGTRLSETRKTQQASDRLLERDFGGQARGGRSHNPKVAGSNPAPATSRKARYGGLFCFSAREAPGTKTVGGNRLGNTRAAPGLVETPQLVGGSVASRSCW